MKTKVNYPISKSARLTFFFSIFYGISLCQLSAQSQAQEIQAVPFAVVEEVPVYPGCEDLKNNYEQKKCLSEKITAFVKENYNTGMAKEIGLNGVNRVIAQFKISVNGEIVDIRSRAPHPTLEEEVKRVLNLLPKMEPGKQRGKAVNVLYSLPIVFTVSPAD